MAYIDLNPVRAGLAESAEAFNWSSYKHLSGQKIDKLVTPHALTWTLGNTPFAREAAYAELVQSGVNPVQQLALTAATLRGWAFGEPDFVADLQKRTQRRVSKGQAGRPAAAIKP
jgi:putative transposase